MNPTPKSASIDRIANNAVYYQNDPRVPMTSLMITFHGGGFQQDPVGLSGMAKIVSKLLFRGTPTLSRETIAQRFDLLGATVDAYVTETDCIVSVSCFSKNLREVLHTIATILRDVHFPQDEIDLVKKHELSSIEASLQDPDRVLGAAHEYVLFGKNSYGKFGSRTAITNITRTDLQQHYLSMYTTSVVFCTVISDLSRETIMQELEIILSNRATNGFTLKPEERFNNTHGREAVIVHSQGASNDRLRWSHHGLTATDDRRFDLYLVIDALGSFEGFLFDQLRNQRGWCYGAYASIMQATTRAGRISYYADPSSETSDKLIPEFLRLLHCFSDEQDFRHRLAERNTTFKNRYAYQLDIRKKLWNEVNRDRYGIPILDRQEYHKRIDAVTFTTAKKVIDSVFDVHNIMMVFYGDAERLQKILSNVDSAIKPIVLEKEILIQ